MGSKLVNLVGEKFGRLTVKSLGESIIYGTSKKRTWNCICACGNKVRINTSNLTNGNTKSCGCLRKEKNADNSRLSRHKLAKTKTGYKVIFKKYKTNADSRGILFEMNENDFISILKQNCYYCGIEPSNKYDKSYYNVIYSGVDRYDNSLGYSVGNCVPCCKTCNVAKNNMSVDEFLGWAQRLSNNIQKLKSK